MTAQHLIEKLNEALGWELRAINMYAHYAAYIRGIHRLQLEPHFTAEANESMDHSNIVRSAIVKLGGIAVTERNNTPIVQTLVDPTTPCTYTYVDSKLPLSYRYLLKG